MTKEKVEKYWQEKKEEIKNPKKTDNTIEYENKLKALNRSLEEREINKIIQSLDKSRSSRHKQTFPNFNKNKSEEKQVNNNDNKTKISVQQNEQNKGKNNGKAKSKSPDNKENKKKTQKNDGKADNKAKEKSPSPQKKATTKRKNVEEIEKYKQRENNYLESQKN